jgi:hypothetical protein
MPYLNSKSTSADPFPAKRERVIRVLNDPNCQNLSGRQMAKLAGVDESFVRKMKKVLAEAQQKAALTPQERKTLRAAAAKKIFDSSARKAEKKSPPKSPHGISGKSAAKKAAAPPKPHPKPKRKRIRGKA